MMGMGTTMMWLMVLTMLIVGIVIVIGIGLLIRLLWSRTSDEKPKNTALSILQQRLARGDIDAQEYQKRLKNLQGKDKDGSVERRRYGHG